MWLPCEFLLVGRSFVTFKIVVGIPFPIVIFRNKAQCFFLKHRNGFKTFSLSENRDSDNYGILLVRNLSF